MSSKGKAAVQPGPAVAQVGLGSIDEESGSFIRRRAKPPKLASPTPEGDNSQQFEQIERVAAVAVAKKAWADNESPMSFSGAPEFNEDSAASADARKRPGREEANLVNWRVPNVKYTDSASGGGDAATNVTSSPRKAKPGKPDDRGKAPPPDVAARSQRSSSFSNSDAASVLNSARPKDSEERERSLRARLWNNAFQQLRRAVDELYHMCELESSRDECREAIRVLTMCQRDFQNLIDRMDVQEQFEKGCEGEEGQSGDRPRSRQSIAWGVRKTSPVRKLSRSGRTTPNRSPHESIPGSPSAPSFLTADRPASMRGRTTLTVDTRASCETPVEDDPGAGVGLVDAAKPPALDSSFLSVSSELTWAQKLMRGVRRSSPQRGRELHEKLSSPERKKRPPTEVKRMQEERQARARELREKREIEKQEKLRLVTHRIQNVSEKQEQESSRRRVEIESKLDRAGSLHEAHLQEIVRKASNEAEKVSEVAFIERLQQANAKIALEEKVKESENRRLERIEETKRRSREEAEKQAAVLERKRRNEAERLNRIANKEERLREAAQKREEERKQALALREARAEQHAKRAEELASSRQAAAVSAERKLKQKMEESSMRHKTQVGLRRERATAIASKLKDGVAGGTGSEQESVRPMSAPARRPTGAEEPERAPATERKERRSSGPPKELLLEAARDSLQEPRRRPGQDSPLSSPVRDAGGEGPGPHTPGFGHALAAMATSAAEAGLSPSQRRLYKRVCRVCNVEIVSDEYLEAHLAGKKHASSLQRARATEQLDADGCIITVAHLGAGGAGAASQRASAGGYGSLTEAELREVKDREARLRKRAKRLRQKLAAPPFTFTEPQPPATDPPSKPKLNRFLQEVGKAIAKKSAEALEALLGELGRVLEQKREGDSVYLRQQGALATLVQIATSRDLRSSASLPAGARMVQAALRALLLLLGPSPDNRSLALASNLIVPLVDTAAQALAQDEPFAPALLHVLTFLLRQPVPTPAHEQAKEDLVSYFVCAGIVDRLRERFKRLPRGPAEGPLALPPLAERAIPFLEALTSFPEVRERPVYQPTETGAAVVSAFRASCLVSMVSLLASTLLQGGAPRACTVPVELRGPLLTTTTAAVKLLNNVALLDLPFVQASLGGPDLVTEFFHLSSFLLLACSAPAPEPQSEVARQDLLHELILLLGYATLQCPGTQRVMQWGNSPTLLQRLAGLPFCYFSDPRYKNILFPTLVAACFGSERNRAILQSEMSADLLATFIAEYRAAPSPAGQSPAGAEGAARAATTTVSIPARFQFANRFPAALWEEAERFFAPQPATEPARPASPPPEASPHAE
eukprot:tig00000711_g3399.t1